jgi:hypothetical protein
VYWQGETEVELWSGVGVEMLDGLENNICSPVSHYDNVDFQVRKNSLIDSTFIPVENCITMCITSPALVEWRT